MTLCKWGNDTHSKSELNEVFHSNPFNVAGFAVSSCASLLDSKPKESQLLTVCEMVLKDWKAVCIYLRIPSWKISESQQNIGNNVMQAFFDTLIWWLSGNCRKQERPPTWRVLCNAMREAGYPDDAETVEEKFAGVLTIPVQYIGN